MPNFPPGTHEYDPERHNLIEGVSKFMIAREEARAKFHEYHSALGTHDEVYTDGSKIDERVGAAAVINRHFQNGETTCRQLSKRLPNNSTIFFCWGYGHHPGTGLLSVHESCKTWCCSLLWLNVLLAGDWGRRYWKPSHLPYHEPPLGTERQRHSCPLLLGAKPLRHRG